MKTAIEVTPLDIGSGGTFSRASKAYLGSNSGMTEYDVDERRTLPALSCSQPAADDGLRTGECGADGNANVWCSNAAGLYAIASGFPNRIYRSADGLTNWMAAYTFAATVHGIFTVHLADGRGRLIAWVGSAGSIMPWYSDDDGEHWTQCTSDAWRGAPFVSGFDQEQATVCAGTYIGASNSTVNQIWQSADYGTTWTKRLELEVGQVTHIHAICYHAGTGKWIADTGDSDLSKRRTYVSVDGGETWTTWAEGKPSPSGQITAMRDYDHPDFLAIGSDQYHRAGWYDVRNWQAGSFQRIQWAHIGGEYLWELVQVQGLWYACHGTDYTSNNRAAILVSDDLTNWVPYWRSTDKTLRQPCRFAGLVGGKLHFLCNFDAGTLRGHLVVSPARLAHRSGVLLTPAQTNLLAADVARCDTLTGWNTTGTPTVFEVDPDTQLVPDGVTQLGCLHLAKTEMAAEASMGMTRPVSLPSGTYVAHAWVKGRAKHLQIRLIPQSTAYYGLRPHGEWTEIWTLPYTGTPTTLVIGCNAEDGSNSAELWVGAVEILAVPFSGAWSPGGVTQAGDALSYDVNLPSDWTLLATACMPGSSGEWGVAASPDRYLLSVADAQNNAVELFWDSSESKWAIAPRDAGGPLTGDAVATTTRYLHRGGLVRVAIRHGQGQFRLSVMDGLAIEHVAEPLRPDGITVDGDQCVIRYGAADGSAGLPVILTDLWLYGQCLSDADLSEIMNQGAWQRQAGGGGQRVEY